MDKKRFFDLRCFLKAGKILILAAALSGFLFPPAAFSYDMWSKAGRGIHNMLFGWAEVFYRPYEMHAEGVGWHSALPGGLIKGVGYAVARTLTGAYELVSFPFPGSNEYGPILQPESVILENAYP